MEKKNGVFCDRISIIVPIYNTEKYLDRCIASIVAQSYENLEIILVDDGSSDNCGIICDRWAINDNRIQVLHKSNGGLSDARNAGLSIATGEYIGFVDSDDYIHMDMYQELFDLIKKYGADMAICEYNCVSEDGIVLARNNKRIGDRCIDKSIFFKEYYSSISYHVVWNKLYHKHLFNEIRFPYGKLYEDEVVSPQIVFQCNRIALTSDALYQYVQTENSITRSSADIRNYDSVEAIYRSLLFFEAHNINDIVHTAAQQLVDKYLVVRGKTHVSLSSAYEKKRIREIKRMVRYSYLKYWKYIRIWYILNIEFPTLFRFLYRIKQRIK